MKQLGPRDLVEDRTQSLALGRIDALYPSDPPIQVRSKVGMVRSVLSLGAKSNAVVERSLELVKTWTRHVHTFVRHQPGYALPHAAPHDARLSMVDIESLFDKNHGDLSRKSFYAAFKFFAARKREVSSPEEFHPEALSAPYLNVSAHTAPAMEPRRTPICQCAHNFGSRLEIRATQ